MGLLVPDESFIGYQEKLQKYQELLGRQKILDQKYQQKVKKYYEAVNVIQYLKENSYLIDPLLAEYVNKQEESVREWTSISNSINQLEKEIHPRRLRHVVYALTSEIGLSLEELAKRLNCSNENTFVDLCEKGSINKPDFQKLCNHFGLDGELWEYHYVYPKNGVSNFI